MTAVCDHSVTKFTPCRQAPSREHGLQYTRVSQTSMLRMLLHDCISAQHGLQYARGSQKLMLSMFIMTAVCEKYMLVLCRQAVSQQQGLSCTKALQALPSRAAVMAAVCDRPLDLCLCFVGEQPVSSMASDAGHPGGAQGTCALRRLRQDGPHAGVRIMIITQQ